jgi:hypothetical protein
MFSIRADSSSGLGAAESRIAIHESRTVLRRSIAETAWLFSGHICLKYQESIQNCLDLLGRPAKKIATTVGDG